jgi:DNA damage-inducible protein 1
MDLTILFGDSLLPFSVSLTWTIGQLKSALAPLVNVPQNNQSIIYQSRTLADSSTIQQCGIKSGDLIEVRRSSVTSHPLPSSVPPSSAPISSSALPSSLLTDPAALLSWYRSQSSLVDHLLTVNPPLGNAILLGNSSLVHRLTIEHMRLTEDKQRQERMEQELMTADPFDLEAQKKIEENIRQQNIAENMAAAMEHSPESFGRVPMLYVKIKINQSPAVAFVDSGAQITICSRKFAERCNLLRLLDTRFAGIAKGVGQAKILGKIHAVQLQFGKSFFVCSFTVLDQNDMDFLFGLDLLRRHEACIDLKTNVLRIGDEAVPFLNEKEIRDAGYSDIAGESEVKSQMPQQTKALSSSVINNNQPSNPSSSSISSLPAASHNESKIVKLVELGFSRSQAIEALQQFNGNEEMAASFLFQRQLDF